jgi:hypothetical protein
MLPHGAVNEGVLMRTWISVASLVSCLVLLTPAAWAQQEDQPQPGGGGDAAGSTADDKTPLPPDMIALAEAYQTGYLQVVAISCFQLYSSTGIIATDFAQGNIQAGTALDALDQNSLLHSACYTTLTAIQQLTPAADTIALAEIGRLLGLLEAEDELLSGLADVIADPTEEHAEAVEAARAKVEQTLDSYMQNDEP